MQCCGFGRDTSGLSSARGKKKKTQHVTGGFPPGITLLTSCPFFSLNHALGQLLFKWVHVPPDLEQLH